MIELDKKQYSVSKADSSVSVRKTACNEIISIEECKGYFSGSNLPNEKIKSIRNNLVGVVDSIINAYLEDFR